MPNPPIAFPFADFLINPQTNWARFFNPQLFISVNSNDAPIENHVLSRVGSYGKQLGVLLDAVEVLTSRLPEDELTPGERAAVAAVTELRADVEAAKADFRGEGTTRGVTRADVEDLLAQLAELERTDETAHAALVQRLRAGLDAES